MKFVRFLVWERVIGVMGMVCFFEDGCVLSVVVVVGVFGVFCLFVVCLLLWVRVVLIVFRVLGFVFDWFEWCYGFFL